MKPHIDPFTVRGGKQRMEWLKELICQGLSNREVAIEMGVSLETVRRYLREMYMSERPQLIVAQNPSDSEHSTTRGQGE